MCAFWEKQTLLKQRMIWCTEYVAASTKPIPAHGGHVLGINIENFDELSSQFNTVTDEVEALHTNLAQVEDAATEIVLVRACADVCKVTHLLRAGGIGIATESLDKYDKLLKLSLERIMGGPIGETPAMQATLGVKQRRFGIPKSA